MNLSRLLIYIVLVSLILIFSKLTGYYLGQIISCYNNRKISLELTVLIQSIFIDFCKLEDLEEACIDISGNEYNLLYCIYEDNTFKISVCNQSKESDITILEAIVFGSFDDENNKFQLNTTIVNNIKIEDNHITEYLMGMRYDKNEEKAAYKDIESITSKKSCNKLKKVYNKYARILTDEDIDELNKISELLVTLVYIILINTECIKDIEEVE